FVELETTRAGANLRFERPGQAAVALAEKAEVDGKRFGRLQHSLDIPRARRAGRGVGARGWPRAAAEERSEPRGDGRLDQLRTNEVNVAVDAARSGDQVLTGDDFGARADDQLWFNAGLDQRIAGLAHADDPAVADADVALDDAPVVEHDGIG